MKPRSLIIACGALAREIRTLLNQNAWDHVTLRCLPAILHNHPNRITPAVRTAVLEARPEFDRIFVAYADCGTGGDLAAACEELGVEMIEGPHCYAFYSGLDEFDGWNEATSFYLTDFLARQFDAFVWRPLGLDRHPELLPMYFGNYEKLVYLAQSEDEALTQAARAAAARLGLEFERRETGFGALQPAVRQAARP